MEKTVNQWLDWIDSLEYNTKTSEEISNFKDELLRIKNDQNLLGYGGKKMVRANIYIESLVTMGHKYTE